MFLYKKVVAYIDYYEDNEKVKNTGHVKLEYKNKECRLQVNIQGLYDTDSFRCEMKNGEGEVLGEMVLEKGTGTFEKNFSECDGGGPSFRNWDEIVWRISDRRCCRTSWQIPDWVLKEGLEETEKHELAAAQAGDPMLLIRTGKRKMPEAIHKEAPPVGKGMETHGMKAPAGGGNLKKEAAPEEIYRESGEGFIGEESQSESLETAGWRERDQANPEAVTWMRFGNPGIRKDTGNRETVHGDREAAAGNRETAFGNREAAFGNREAASGNRETASGNREAVNGDREAAAGATETEAGEEKYFTDKWMQLMHNYTVVHPFGEDRSFISISPRDFIILQKDYQKLVNNSFLLHGYYNYRHVILGNLSRKGEEVLYLGVPGVYYEREKMVAEMFGFEGFECGETMPEQGTFGYYMRRVGI